MLCNHSRNTQHTHDTTEIHTKPCNSDDTRHRIFLRSARALHTFSSVLSCSVFFSLPHTPNSTENNGQPGAGSPCGPVEESARRGAAHRGRRAAAAQPPQPIGGVDCRTDDDVAVTQCSGRPPQRSEIRVFLRTDSWILSAKRWSDLGTGRSGVSLRCRSAELHTHTVVGMRISGCI